MFDLCHFQSSDAINGELNLIMIGPAALPDIGVLPSCGTKGFPKAAFSLRNTRGKIITSAPYSQTDGDATDRDTS